MALAVGLAVLASNPKLERATFEPANVRRRREFLNKSLFLYLAAALVIAIVLPAYILSSNSLAEAEKELKDRQQGPIGRYQGASTEIPMLGSAQQRADKRFEAVGTTLMPGRVATEVLIAFAAQRPETVRISKVELKTDTDNPTNDKDFKARTLLRMSFFIEKKPGADPIEVNDQLLKILRGLKGVSQDPKWGGVTSGSSTANDSAQGIDVTHTVVLDLGLEKGAK
jgi:hypothetical protein